MKTGRIIHQQIMQLKWHFLACLGLLMTLPIEEAIINLKDGEGFYASGLSLGIPVMAGTLLAGLIACGNVQADLDERRHIFWRSKPVGAKSFIALKYMVGLFMAFLVISAPVLFGLISSKVHGEKFDRAFVALIINFQLISLLTYSVCFFCNALVRKTAQAWLIGMAIVCFLLLVPFVLPFRFKDISGDFLLIASTVYIAITVGASLAAFIVSLFAVNHNWHLQTNLKGLLWTGATMIFLAMLLFTRQVANIKVLDEIEIDAEHAYIGSLNRISDSVLLASTFEVDTNNQKIQLVNSFSPPSEALQKQRQGIQPFYTREKDHYPEPFPRYSVVSYCIGEQLYTFRLNSYYIREKVGKNSWAPKYKKAYICSYRLAEGIYRVPVSALDLADCIDEKKAWKAGLRQIDDKLIIFIQDSFAVIQIKADGSLELVEKRINGLKGYSRHLSDREKIFKIPMMSIDGVELNERVKLTVDVNYGYHHFYSSWRSDNLFCENTHVDIDGDKISFCLLDEGGIQRYDVVKWDEEYIYCKFRDERPFTFLEQMFSLVTTDNDPWFLQDGKLYVYENQKLMVFDIRSNSIRKLGHFERLREDYRIRDIEVLDNGDILLCAETEKRIITKSPDPNRKYDDYFIRKGYLSLLKNPE